MGVDQHNEPPEVSLGLAMLLASIVVHADEMLSPLGHTFDRVALEQAINNPEVQQWIKMMTAAGLAPVKRNQRQ